MYVAVIWWGARVGLYIFNIFFFLSWMMDTWLSSCYNLYIFVGSADKMAAALTTQELISRVGMEADS